jgi:hypothetical protein
MRAEGREVRCVGAIKLLTAKQVQLQLALRHFLDGLSVRRSGNDKELRPLLEAQVAAEVAKRAEGGEEAPAEAVEVARLQALGFGRKQRAGGGGQRPARPAQGRKRSAKPAEGDASSGSDASGDEDSDESESEEEEEEIDIDELLQKDEDVFEVEKLLEWRSAEGGGREFLVKWKGFSAKETTWEPEANVLEKGMIKAVLKKPEFGKRAAPQKKAKPVESAQAPPPPPPPEPTRARSSRAGAQAASEAARRANQLDAASDDEEASEESGEEEAVHPPPPPRAVPTAPGKKQKAVPQGQRKRPATAAPKPAAKKQKGKPKQPKGKARLPIPDTDSSDEDTPLDQRVRVPQRPADSSDEE